MSDIEKGQIWRSTDGDGRILRGGIVFRNDRIVQIVEREPDGRWLTQTVGGRGRKSRVKEATLRSGYELQSATI